MRDRAKQNFPSGAFLYVPADTAAYVASARRQSVSGVILDLEDAVAPDRKAAALEAAIGAVAQGGFSAALWVRINQGSQGIRDAQIVGHSKNLTGVWLPKVSDVDEINVLASALPARVTLGLIIESAAGLFALPDLVRHPRVGAIQIGEVDLAADLGINPAKRGVLDPYRAMVVAACAMGALPPPMGPVWEQLDDVAGFESSTLDLIDQGFGGRGCLNPSQGLVAERMFLPTLVDIESARDAIARHEQLITSGVGVYRSADGRMVDNATIRRARALLDRADSTLPESS